MNPNAQTVAELLRRLHESRRAIARERVALTLYLRRMLRGAPYDSTANARERWLQRCAETDRIITGVNQ